MKKLPMLVAAWMCLFLVTTENAHAESFALGQVSIDWSALAFSGIPIDFNGRFLNVSGAFVVSGDKSDVMGSRSNASFDTFGSAFVSSVVDGQGALAAGTAFTSDSEISASSFLSAGGQSESATTQVNGNREVFFFARETGLLTVSVPFTISTEVNVQLPGESAGMFGSAQLLLQSFFLPNQQSDVDQVAVDPFLEGVGSSSDLISGTLRTSLLFEAGQFGRVWTSADSNGQANSVPEPSSVLLLGCGLAGMVAARWRLGQPPRT